MIELFQWILAAVSITGTILNAAKNSYCWYVWILASILGMAYSVITRQWGMVLMFNAFLFSEIFGLIKWRAGDIKKSPKIFDYSKQ